MFKFEDNIGLLVLKMIASQDLRWDIDGTGARDELDPKLRWKSYNPNMDLELQPKWIWSWLLKEIDLSLVLIWW